MLVFSEGVPRSGKSYDAVKNHILPALKKGRRVYARLNGLHHERIAAYLKLPVDQVNELLQVVPTDRVRELFVATKDHDNGQWTIDPKFKNALIVIDEVHEFYVGGGRDRLPEEIEQFFALHGHYGMDVLTMTQFYKRVHTAIRYRIERKNTFQKLGVLGKLGETMYRETRWQTIAPDRYEKVGGSTKKYEIAIYALYHGIVGGTDAGDVEQEVYEGGRATIWRRFALVGALIIPLGIFGVYYLVNFFGGGGASLVNLPDAASRPVAVSATPGVPDMGGVYQPAGPSQAGKPVEVKTEREKHVEAMTPEQQYVWNMSQAARIRFTGSLVRANGEHRGFLEWYDGSENVLDRLSLDQVKAMGIVIEVASFGVKLLAGGEALVATAWPVNKPLREREPRLYNTSGDQPSVSEASARLIAQADYEASNTASDAGGVGAGQAYGAAPKSSGNFALDPLPITP